MTAVKNIEGDIKNKSSPFKTGEDVADMLI